MVIIVFILGAAFGVSLMNLLTVCDRIVRFGPLEALVIDALVEGAAIAFILSFLNMLTKLE